MMVVRGVKIWNLSKNLWEMVGKQLRNLHTCDQFLCQQTMSSAISQPFSKKVSVEHTFKHYQLMLYLLNVMIQVILVKETDNQSWRVGKT